MFWKKQPKNIRTFLGESVFWIETDRIQPNPHQPRRDFDDASLEDLKNSIAEKGILQPLIVVRLEPELGMGPATYEIIAGERRLRAAKLLSMQEVPVIVVKTPESDQEKLELSLVENVQREDLNPMERARAFDRLQREFGLTQQEIGRKIGKSREVVANTMRLVSLEPPIQDAILSGEISEGHGRALLAIPGLAERFAALQEIKERGLSVRDAEAMAQALRKSPRPSSVAPAVVRGSDGISDSFKEVLGADVKIQQTKKGGRITISFSSQEDLESILQRLKKS